jgi:release factor glutamine methyltransferase
MLQSELLKIGANFLKKKLIHSYQIDSEVLLAEILGKPRENILLNSDLKISQSNVKIFSKLIKRRGMSKVPLAYLLKKKEFWSFNINVSRDVLIPRPETELLVEKLVSIYKGQKPFILDVGTGSGCIIISLLKELNNAKGVAIDISNKAIMLAKNNSINNNTSNRIKFSKSCIKDVHRTGFDLIVSNPPYIPSNQLKNLDVTIKHFEPKIALDGGNDGLDVIRKLIYKSGKILKRNGLLALEIGNGQYKKVSQILKKNKFIEKFLVKDYRDNIRCIISALRHY